MSPMPRRTAPGLKRYRSFLLTAILEPPQVRTAELARFQVRGSVVQLAALRTLEDDIGYFRIKGFCLLYTSAALLAVLPATTSAGPVAGIANCLAIAYVTALHNSQVQVLFMEVAEEAYPQALNFASSLNPTFYNIGIAAGS